MNNSETILIEIIETAYKLLTRKLANGGITARNENAFQLELGHILMVIGQLYEFKLSDKFHLEFEAYYPLSTTSIKSKSTRARIDLLLSYYDGNITSKAAIELKFFKKENHREPNSRYDVFKDISNLELYKKNGINTCFFILATDHNHYVCQNNYSSDTSDFDFRHGSKYIAKSILKYKTNKPYGPDIVLQQDYEFKWDTMRDLHFLKIKV